MSIQFLTSNIIHTSILLICLYRYASRQQTQYSMLIGILSAIMPTILIGYITPSNTLHLLFSLLLMILLSYIGYHMVQPSKSKRDISLMLLCVVYLMKQALESDKIDEPWQVIMAHLISSLLLAVVFSMTMWYATPWCQQCVYSIMIYWTAAIQCAEWIGYLELIHHPSYRLIFIMRSSYHSDTLMNYPVTVWQTIGYSVYWMIISILLIYSRQKKKKGNKKTY